MTAVKRNNRQGTRKTPKGRAKRGWGARIETAILQVQAARRRRISLEEVGEIVAAAEGRRAAFGKGTVSAWITERNEPKIRTFEVIAELADCDPWWIVWEVGRPPANVLDEASEKEPRPKAVAAAEGS